MGVKERFVWSTATFVSIPGITTIMCRDWYLTIKSALSFQLEDESTSQQNLHKIGLLLDHFHNVCKTVWNPFQEISVDEMMVLFTGSSHPSQFTKL